MTKFRMLLTVIAITIFSSTIAFAQIQCMFIGAQPGADNQQYDSLMVPILESWGYGVDWHIVDDIANYTEADYEGYDFIFLSESIISGLSAPLINIPLPMVNSEGWSPKFSALRWAPEPNADHCFMTEPVSGVQMLAAGAGHELAAGIKAGTHFNVCDTTDLVVYSKPEINHIPIAAQAADTSWLLVYGVEKGTTLHDTTITTQNRCAMVGVHAWGYETLTPEAMNLYKAAINWVLNKPFNLSCMFIGAVEGAENQQYDAYMVDYLESWGVSVDVHVDDDLPNYTDADYEDYDFIFLSESIISGKSAPLINIPLPMVNSEGWSPKFSALRWAPEPNSNHCWMTEPMAGVKMLEAGAGHQLAAGIPAGTAFNVCDTTDLVVFSIPTIDHIPIVSHADSSNWLLAYGVEEGTTLQDTAVTTQSRCAMVGVHAWGYETLTPDAIQLYKAAIAWVNKRETSIEMQSSIVSDQYKLLRNYPNPFNPVTHITYSIAKEADVTLKVYNVMGEEITTLVNAKQNTGQYTIMFDGSNLSSGVYFYQLQTTEHTVTQKMLLTK